MILVAYVILFFGPAVAYDDLEAVDSLKRSAYCTVSGTAWWPSSAPPC